MPGCIGDICDSGKVVPIWLVLVVIVKYVPINLVIFIVISVKCTHIPILLMIYVN